MLNNSKLIFIVFSPVFLIVGYYLGVIQSADAMTMNTIRVPISWCATNGSEAADSPNIPDPWGGVDTTTDDVLWRRHERATDNIYLSQGTGITFRSGINDAVHSSWNFPIINDPRAIGSPGNVTFEETGTGVREYRLMLNDCFDKWQELINQGTVSGTPGVFNGIPVINIRQFVHIGGSVDQDLIGKAICEKSAPGLACRNPWNGYVFVMDNCYTAVGATCGGIGWNNDPFDQNIAHELGHALGLIDLYNPSDSNRLMFWEQQENGAGGTVNNIEISDPEKIALRNNALLTPNAEMDPPDKIIQGQIVQSVKVDNLHENKSLQTFEDLALVKITLDKKQNIVYIDQELSGLIPEDIKRNNLTHLKYWTLIDLDNNTRTGGNQSLLHNIGVPSTNFKGADLVFVASINGYNSINNANVTGTGWVLTRNNTEYVSIPENSIITELNTMFMESHYRDKTKNSATRDIPIFNTVRTALNNSGFIQLNKPFSIQTIVEKSGTIVDTLHDELESKWAALELRQPFFPQCYTENDANKGGNTTVSVTGFPSNSSIHLLLGPRFITNDKTDSSGNSTFSFLVPKDTSSGLRLITIGIDKSALTADCEIMIP